MTNRVKELRKENHITQQQLADMLGITARTVISLEKGNYNPFVASGKDWTWEAWEQVLVLCMQRCTTYFEKLPLVQDKGILDNILYSGVWLQYRQKQRQQTKRQGGNP